MHRVGLSLLAMLAVAPRPGFAQKLPEKWAGKGLVIGQLVGTAPYGLATDAEILAKFIVGRRDADGGMFHGLIVFRQDEGLHELKSVYSGGHGVSIPIGRTFHATKGQVTVLGMLTLVPNPQNTKEYRVVAIDNVDETIDFLRRTYPQLLAGRDQPVFVKAPGNYLPPERLVLFRRTVARNAARRSGRQGRFWVAGSAGTIAEVEVAGDSVNVVRFLPPVTYQEPITTSWDESGVLTFGVFNRWWRVVEGVVEPTQPPERG